MSISKEEVADSSMDECYESSINAPLGHGTKQDGMNDSSTSSGVPLGPFSNDLR